MGKGERERGGGSNRGMSLNGALCIQLKKVLNAHRSFIK